MPESDTLLEEDTALDQPWNVVVYDDPVNLMDYVTWVFMKVLSLPKSVAERRMMEVHEQGRSIVWHGKREEAELHTQQLQAHQLQAKMEKPGE